MLLESLRQTWASGLLDGLFDADAQLGVGRNAANGFDSRRGLASLPFDESKEKVHRLRQSGKGDGAEQNSAEPAVRSGAETRSERGLRQDS